MSIIAREDEALSIGGGGCSSYVANRCVTRARAISMGNTISTSYADNQLVQKSALSKACACDTQCVGYGVAWSSVCEGYWWTCNGDTCPSYCGSKSTCTCKTANACASYQICGYCSVECTYCNCTENVCDWHEDIGCRTDDDGGVCKYDDCNPNCEDCSYCSRTDCTESFNCTSHCDEYGGAGCTCWNNITYTCTCWNQAVY